MTKAMERHSCTTGGMEPSPKGEWVSWIDAQQLLAELDRLERVYNRALDVIHEMALRIPPGTFSADKPCEQDEKPAPRWMCAICKMKFLSEEATEPHRRLSPACFAGDCSPIAAVKPCEQAEKSVPQRTIKFADSHGNVVMEGSIYQGNEVIVDAVELVNYIGGASVKP